MLPGGTSIQEIALLFSAMEERGRIEVAQAQGEAQGGSAQEIEIERFVDMRYRGQSYELIVPFSDALLSDFHRIHQQTYGYAMIGAETELVNLRVRAVLHVAPPDIAVKRPVGLGPTPAYMERRPVLLNAKNGFELIPFYRGEDLQPGNQINGPAIVVRSDNTSLMGHGDRGKVDAYGDLLIAVSASA